MAQKQIIHTTDAPAALGPYSQAIVSHGMVFTAGQLGLDPATRTLTTGIQDQTRQALTNIQAVLAAAGCTMADVVKTSVFLKDMNDFAAMNEIYATFFPEHPPARTTVQVARLPQDAHVEIECVAFMPD